MATNLKKYSGANYLNLIKEKAASLDPSQKQQKKEPADAGEYWYPKEDAAGNGEAIIRFLPPHESEDIPFVHWKYYRFQGPTGEWYNAKSLKNLGQPDPVHEFNRDLWALGTEDAKDQYRKQKHKETFVANVYVIKDKNSPENEGKVFKYRFGPLIWKMIKEQMQPEFDDIEPVNPFDPVEGANFRLRFKTSKWRDYSASKFDNPSPLFKDNKQLEEVLATCYPLQPLVSEDKFKTYDELKARLHRVLALDTPVNRKPRLDDEDEVEAPKAKAASSRQSALTEDDDEDFSFAVDDED